MAAAHLEERMILVSSSWVTGRGLPLSSLVTFNPKYGKSHILRLDFEEGISTRISVWAGLVARAPLHMSLIESRFAWDGTSIVSKERPPRLDEINVTRSELLVLFKHALALLMKCATFHSYGGIVKTGICFL